ncbi:9667_t:CDS:1, partial [Ambispora gerdemannii]
IEPDFDNLLTANKSSVIIPPDQLEQWNECKNKLKNEQFIRLFTDGSVKHFGTNQICSGTAWTSSLGDIEFNT